MSRTTQDTAAPVEAPTATLLEIARRHGTPTYAYDLDVMRAQVDMLRNALPGDVDVLYSLKANASLGLSSLFASCGIAASPG